MTRIIPPVAQIAGQMHGVVPLAKPEGPSSAQCLTTFKRQGQKKIGHAGTLDPMASGVLLVLLGQATKLSGWLLGSGRKVYRGVLRLGIETDTWDIQGRIVAEQSWTGIRVDAVKAAIAEWQLLTEQEVPAYSAAKHHGQPLYKLARKGHDIPAKWKSARIFEAAMLDASMPHVSFRVSCSSGSYIRSLAHSLGMRLGCGAALTELTREYSHPFSLAQCVDLEEIRSGLLPRHVQPMQQALPAWPLIQLNEAEITDCRNGRPIAARGSIEESMAFLCAGERPVAIGRRKGDRWLVERGLWND